MSIHRKKTPDRAEHLSLIELEAMNLLGEAFCSIQQLYMIEPFTYFALAGKVLGETMACNDCAVEKEHNVKEDDEEKEPYKKTFFLNYDVSYNEHRAKHERRECVEKPEPKIV